MVRFNETVAAIAIATIHRGSLGDGDGFGRVEGGGWEVERQR